jgi:two-component system, chemotaxis family, sensor kinase CheA
MYQDLLALESAGLDDEVVHRFRRSAHTIKGDAGCVDLPGVTEIAHSIEDTIDRVIAGEQGFKAEVVDSIFEALDAMRAAIGGDEMRDIPAAEIELLCRGLATAKSSAPANELSRLAAPSLHSPEPQEEAESQREAQGNRRQDFVRVEATTIDALLNLAGEMVVARSVMNQVGVELETALAKSEVGIRFHSANAEIGKLIAELQKSVLKLRMVSISQVFKRFSRPMRELAGEYGKQLELVTAGEETELDRALVDMLYEPLLHLLRNAVDHGMESPEERVAAGKPEGGTIKLSSYHEGNQVVVEVSDDGRGIDVERLKKRAVETGALSESAAFAMTGEDALNLIFYAGLSTAQEVTWISGRGVGGGAVKAALEQLRGSISVRSVKDAGTTFTLRMPLTLAIIKALLFTAGGRLYALPLLAISEITAARADRIAYIDGLESYRLRDRFLSLVRPGKVLGTDRRKGGAGTSLRGPSAGKDFFIIVVTTAGKRYGVLADSLLGEQELVIKPLDSDWLQSEALAGASVLGDGNVVLILDAGILLRKAIKYERTRSAGVGVYVQ